MSETDMVTRNAMPLAGLDDAPSALFTGATGLEGADADCYTIPFLKIAGTSNEEAKKGSSKYIAGLQPGMFFSPSLHKIYGEKIRIVILKFYRTYVIYDGEGMDSKFMGTIDPDTFRRDIEPQTHRVKSYAMDNEGRRYVDTRNFIVMNYDDPDAGPLILPMYSTGIKPSKDLITQSQHVKAKNAAGVVVTAPTWWNVWELGLGYFDNPLGGYYQIKTIERLGGVPNAMAPMFKAAFDEMQGVATDIISASESEPETRNVTPEPVKPVVPTAPASKTPVKAVKDLFGAEEQVF